MLPACSGLLSLCISLLGLLCISPFALGFARLIDPATCVPLEWEKLSLHENQLQDIATLGQRKEGVLTGPFLFCDLSQLQNFSEVVNS